MNNKNRGQQKHNKMGKKSRSNLFACIYRISIETGWIASSNWDISIDIQVLDLGSTDRYSLGLAVVKYKQIWLPWAMQPTLRSR